MRRRNPSNLREPRCSSASREALSWLVPPCNHGTCVMGAEAACELMGQGVHVVLERLSDYVKEGGKGSRAGSGWAWLV